MRTFLTGLDEDLRSDLMVQLRNLWTHTSTAIEGNTLTLGETAFVLGEGLTVSGKPLKDHEEVVGHARAIDLLYSLVNRQAEIDERDIFALHGAVLTGGVIDVYRPVGAWKVEPNGVWAKDAAGRSRFVEFAPPAQVPTLMRQWLALMNAYLERSLSPDGALVAYAILHTAFVRIHPFADGNGRLARLLANLPVLRSGHPPVVIPATRRTEYIRLLGAIDAMAGPVEPGRPLAPDTQLLDPFHRFCADVWGIVRELVEAAWKRQEERR